MRALLQSRETGKFLAHEPGSGAVVWVRSLRHALQFGVLDDPEHIAQLVEDHCDIDGADIVFVDQEV
jgi:hypothetical protein